MAVHAGHVMQSAIVPGNINSVWGAIKNMDFKFSKSITQCRKEEDDGLGLGAFAMVFADNTVQTVRVTEISERLPTKHTIGYELIGSDPSVSYSARMDTITISSVTHGAEPCCFVEFSSDFSSDAAIDVIEDSKFKKQEFLDDLAAFGK